MNNTTRTGILLSAAVVIVLMSVGATLTIQKIHFTPAAAVAPPAPVTPPVPVVQLAQVMAVSPHFESLKKPTRHCYPTEKTVYTPNTTVPIAGTLIGGLAGGLAGSAVKGNQRGLAIGAGAALGALTGSIMQKSMQQPTAEVQYSSHCFTKLVAVKAQKGYEVTYLYNGQQGMMKMDNAPLLNSWILPPAAAAIPLSTSASPTPTLTVTAPKS